MFELKYSDKWASIEATFIADARFLANHWPHPGWQPNWYTGTRFDFVYPPALRYGTALILKSYYKFTAAQAYHIYAASMYCLGIAGVYLLARIGGRSRPAAWFAAIAVAMLSPSFLFITDLRNDSFNNHFTPLRLGVLHRYGEGPHMSAVAMLGFALAFSFRALLTGAYGWIVAAAVACALVVSNNFYGATALAMLFPVLLWSCWITQHRTLIFLRALAIAAIGYGLTAFWLVPSYFTITLENMRFVSERGNRWSLWLFLVLAIVYMKLTERWAKDRPDRLYSVFLIGVNWVMFLNVIGNYYLQFRVIGEPTRMAPELDMTMILATAEILRRLYEAEWPFKLSWLQKNVRWRYAMVAVLALACFWPAKKYPRRAWQIFEKDPNYKERLEYQITDWLAKNRPASRSYTSGTMRFWFNAWFDLAQLGGGSEQGQLDPITMPATWNLGMSENGDEGVVWMQALGVDNAIVHDKTSTEHYKDIVHPEKFKGKMEVIYDDGKGNFIYEVPRRYRSLARVVDNARFDAIPMVPEDPPVELLRPIVKELEEGPDSPTVTTWNGTDELLVEATTQPGQSIFLQMAYDTPWQALEGAVKHPTRKSQFGFLRIDPPPGAHRITLRFVTPMENQVGRGLTLGTLGLIGFMLIRRRNTL